MSIMCGHLRHCHAAEENASMAELLLTVSALNLRDLWSIPASAVPRVLREHPLAA